MAGAQPERLIFWTAARSPLPEGVDPLDEGERVLIPEHDRVVLIREDGSEITRFKLLEDATEYARKHHVVGATLAIKTRRVLAYHAPYGQRIKLRLTE